jgi:hypothetical protein
MKNPTNKDWSKAIACRIADELPLQEDFPEDAALLQKVLETLFSRNSWAVNKLIGTGII